MSNRKKIKLCYLHPSVSKSTILKSLRLPNNAFHIVFDDQAPDYILATEQIYYVKEMYRKFLKLFQSRPDAITVFFAGECIAPDLNLFDYAIVFDKKLSFGDRIFRHPTFDFFRSEIFQKDNTLSFEDAMKEYKQRKFCNFIYSNPSAPSQRDRLFYLLNKYKKVDSLGSHLNNSKLTPSRNNQHWAEISIRLKSNYRFSIAAENASYIGYTSEKIITSMQAHTVPVYWGDSTIEDEFNPKAFINSNHYSDWKALLLEIKRIDNDPLLWSRMVAEPWRTKEQREKQNQESRAYQLFIEHIFSQDKCKAKRKGYGTWPNNYLNFICKHSYAQKHYQLMDKLTGIQQLNFKYK